ncbi:MAG: hypothetical protein L0Y54_18645 [Sporichthyaceae bacterium]|nr:hypothetical protein [Sporichthyaceae bacterium]
MSISEQTARSHWGNRSADRAASPLDTAEAAFRLLATGPGCLVLHGRRLGCGLPQAWIPLGELAELVNRPGAPARLRQAVWQRLVRRAQTGDPAWVVAAIGMAAPSLRAACGQLTAGFRGDTYDIDAEVIAGFLAALRRVDPARPRLGSTLWRAAYRAGFRARYRQDPVPVPSEYWDTIAAPVPFGHPDLVLAEAVSCGAINAMEAELIAQTRIEDKPLAAVASALGLPYQAARRRRARAERGLVALIVEGGIAGPGVYRLLHPDAA